MEYHAVPDAHEEAFDDLLVYAFTPERGPDYDIDWPDQPPSFDPRALYDTETVAATTGAGSASDAELDAADLAVVCGYYDFSAQIRGAFHDVGALTAVASPPEMRRKGLIRDLLTEWHRELRDDGVAFAALWPFEFPFYSRLGYARVSDYTRITVAPDALASACPDPAGRFERLSADDWPRLDAVYDEWANDEFRLNRTEGWWRARVLQSWETDPYVYGWHDETPGDDLGGYLVYTIVDEDDAGRAMAVHEFGYRDRAARGHLLRFCRNHDSQVDEIRISSHSGERLFDDLDDPRAAETAVRPGPMARIVDVADALEAVSYPAAVAGDVVLDVRDDTCSWNDGAVRLSVDERHATVESVDAADGDAVSLDIGTLSRLVVGARDAAQLRELGQLTGGDEAARGLLDAAFPATDPFLREGF